MNGTWKKNRKTETKCGKILFALVCEHSRSMFVRCDNAIKRKMKSLLQTLNDEQPTL